MEKRNEVRMRILGFLLVCVLISSCGKNQSTSPKGEEQGSRSAMGGSTRPQGTNGPSLTGTALE